MVVIAQGRIMYDGSLAGIIDQFSGHKIVTLQLPADATVSADLSRYGEVIETQLPKVKIRVDRRAVGEVLPAILATQSIEDVSVEDPPLEEVIAGLFSRAASRLRRKKRSPEENSNDEIRNSNQIPITNDQIRTFVY